MGVCEIAVLDKRKATVLSATAKMLLDVLYYQGSTDMQMSEFRSDVVQRNIGLCRTCTGALAGRFSCSPILPAVPEPYRG